MKKFINVCFRNLQSSPHYCKSLPNFKTLRQYNGQERPLSGKDFFIHNQVAHYKVDKLHLISDSFPKLPNQLKTRVNELLDLPRGLQGIHQGISIFQIINKVNNGGISNFCKRRESNPPIIPFLFS